MSSKPAPTAYLQLPPDSKTIDLVGLCRRLCAEYQYHDTTIDGNLVEIEKFESATGNRRVLKLIKRKLEASLPLGIDLPWKQPGKKDVVKILSQFPITKYAFMTMLADPDQVQERRRNCIHKACGGKVVGLEHKRVTAKDFKYIKTTPEGCPNAANLKDKELRRIYWRLKLKYADYAIGISLGLVIEELKKQKYAGLLLPNGKVVPFEALHSALFNFVPKELSLFEYSVEGVERSAHPCTCYEPDIIELKSEFFSGPNAEPFCIHNVLALNLPEEDAQGKLGRVMIIDPTCAQFGMEGTNGELLFWGYYDDYVKAFPAAKNVGLRENLMWSHSDRDHTDDSYLVVAKGALENLKLESCGYCGDVPRKSEDGETKLKTCSRCMKAYYCDALCQKMAWKGHKLECKPE